MAEKNTYPGIDMDRTGVHLKKLIRQKGYSVKDIQKMLNLSCPQPIYRWFKGQILPSVDHLFALSRFLDVHMEELLVPREELLVPAVELFWSVWESRHIYLLKYWMYARRNCV
ncbi:MAG: helix-turn-helix domain-containing protein [Lachnospiraceae bacterium]|nr:helix-turn-helix domain-containing protein [Lachnospiraceae bacterium]